ncbi:profilin-1 [Gadus macrocephalus]|uniref:profilin-1 n=1 Tax=Gadus macrocephalus TaxID=80720 RepID=UPI0028CB1C73|nr:profilin-1 [Gadus macrocephalus]
MSWNDYIATLMGTDKTVTEDAAILCFTENSEAVWASHSNFKDITAAEVKRLVSTDRSTLFTDGLTLGGQKCRVILDNLHKEDEAMNLMTKDGNAITVSKAKTALVLLKGCKSIHGRQLLPQTMNMAKYLKDNGF